MMSPQKIFVVARLGSGTGGASLANIVGQPSSRGTDVTGRVHVSLAATYNSRTTAVPTLLPYNLLGFRIKYKVMGM